MSREYWIGQTVPFDYPRGITAPVDIKPTWYALVVPPQKERAVRDYLRSKGLVAFYPSETRTRERSGKRQKITKPIVSRLVYAKFEKMPNWDVMREQRRLITGVVGHNGWPLPIPRNIIRRLQGLTVGVAALQEAKREFAQIIAGDEAHIDAEGPLKGWAVEIDRVSGGIAWFTYKNGLGKGTASVSSLRKDISDAEEAEIRERVLKELPEGEDFDISEADGPE